MKGSAVVAGRFGQNLRAVRGQTGLSQEQLGLRAGLHRTEIGLLERGARVPRIDTLIKIANGLDVSVGLLIAGIEWRPADAEPGAFAVAPASEGFSELLERAAALRARQPEEVDAVALIREGREELDARIDKAFGED